MARIYEETVVSECLTAVPLEAVWRYIRDADAQIRHHPRVRAIRMVSGEWGRAGSTMSMTSVDAHGVENTTEVELVSVDEPRSYSMRVTLPDVVTVNVVSTEPHADGTVLRSVVHIHTRPVNWIERLVVKSKRGERQIEADDYAEVTRQAVEDFYAALG